MITLRTHCALLYEQFCSKVRLIFGGSPVIFVLYFLIFRQSIVWIFTTLSDSFSYEYGLVFFFLFLILGFSLYRKRAALFRHVSFQFSSLPFFLLIFTLTVDLFNVLFFHYSILSAFCFLLGFYSLTGFYLQKDIWERGFPVVLLFGLTLPVLPNLQTFFGFPIRILTAKIVSCILDFMNISHFSASTVIMTENNATNIDLPCSGVKSIYAGAYFVLALWYLKRIHLSVSSFFAIIVFFLSLIFFNIWRVFSLVYIYSVLGMTFFGDAIHVSLGIFGFSVSCIIFWKMIQPTLTKEISPNGARSISRKNEYCVKKNFLVFLCLVFFISGEIVVLWRSNSGNRKQNIPALSPINFSVKNYPLTEIPLSAQEQKFFMGRDISLSKKYHGLTSGGIPFSLLLVSSTSWKAHHDPEVCLQGSGYTLDGQRLLQSGGFSMKEVILNKNQAKVFYWFEKKDQVITDYSERVWDGILHPGTSWTLVEVGFEDMVDVHHKDISEVILAVHDAVKQLKND